MTRTLFFILLAFSTAFSNFVKEVNDGDTNMEDGASAAMYNALKEFSTEVTNFKAVSLRKGPWVTKCSRWRVEKDNIACNISMPQVMFHFALTTVYGHFYSVTVNISGLLLRATFAYNNTKVNLVRVDKCTSDLVVVPADFPLRNVDEFMDAFKDELNSCIPVCRHSFHQSDQLSESQAGIAFENP